MAREQIEREDKYDVGADFVLPDLSHLVPEGSVEAQTYELTATYFDTPTDDLRRNGITFRSRKGGHDAGWHLKLPAGAARTEISVESTASAPPRELSQLVLGVRRGQRLVRRAMLSTTRHSKVLTGAEGHVLAEVTDDLVHAVTVDADPLVTEWRELEVELGPDADSAVLAQVGAVLTQAGARPSDSVSKLARAMGRLPDLPRPDGVGGLVDDYLQEQYAAIVAGDVGLRRDDNRIHSTRVAIRRLRSTLRVFAQLFESGAAEHLQGELAWYAGVLGAVRDLDVQGKRLADQIAGLPPEYVIGPVASDLDSTLAAERATAWRKARAAMNGKRYLALLTELEAWRASPPFTAGAHQDAERIEDFVVAAEQALGKRLHRAITRETDDELFHSARKAAKRYRYAGELAEPVLGAAVTDAIGRTKDLQTLLGEHQDSVVSSDLLRRLAAQTPGDGFTYGVLLAQQEQITAQTRAAVVVSAG